ncbi:PITH domain-containing protein [Zopfochytrium polystomum]|nr:PITH domain-containing protein [Zopfochytrium polystomum]
MGIVTDIASDEEFARTTRAGDSPNKLVVVMFTATWCGPCKAIKPFYKELSERFQHVQFTTVDIDKLRTTAQQHNITAVPTFNFYKNGQVVGQSKGGNPRALEDLVVQHQGPAGADGGVGSNLSGHSDLSQFIESRQVECLNQSDTHTVKGIFVKDPSQYLESDVDEQLIINIPFMQAIKVHSLKLVAPLANAPKTIRTFVNRATTLSFDEADSLQPTEQIELAESSYTKDGPLGSILIPLRFVKYQSVHALTIFVQDNITGADTTSITQLILYGSPIESTKDLKELKKEHEHDH